MGYTIVIFPLIVARTSISLNSIDRQFVAGSKLACNDRRPYLYRKLKVKVCRAWHLGRIMVKPTCQKCREFVCGMK